MPRPERRNSGPIRALRQFFSARRGATAVEFALIALPFFALLLGVIEIGMIFLIATTLEDATNAAARQIRIGALQSQSTTETAAAFQASICSNLTWLGSSCAGNLEVDVRTFTQFQNVSLPNPISGGKLQPQSQLQFNMGGPGDIVLVRAYFPWTLIAPLLDGMTTQTSSGQTLITATATFRNEPYPTTP